MTSPVWHPIILDGMSAWRNRRARAAMKDKLPLDSEFDQFVLDHFETVWRVIPSNSADRLARENALIQKVGAEAILRALEGPRYALYWLGLVAAAIGLVAVGALAASHFPSPKLQPNIDMTVLANADLSMPRPPPPMPAPLPEKRVKSPSVPKRPSLGGYAECNGPICRLLGISTQTLIQVQKTHECPIVLHSKDGTIAKCALVSDDGPLDCRIIYTTSNIPLVSPRWSICEQK